MLILKINWGQLTEYPFNASVWGNASDWVMIIVTGVTAYFLWKTFRSQIRSIGIQNETLNEQQKITRIEQFRHTESIKPNFQLTFVPFERRNRGANRQKTTFNFIFELFNHHARNVIVSSDRKIVSRFLGLEFPLSEEIVNVGETINYIQGEVDDLSFTNDDRTEYILFVNFTINFEDIEGNNYEQEIKVIATGSQEPVIISGPSVRQN